MIPLKLKEKENFPYELALFSNFEIVGSVSKFMVEPIVEVLGTNSQKEKWLPLLRSVRVIGAYAQTELGHGSDVQNLQTRATLDENTNEFIMHCPNVSSYKWWPGELGISCNVAVCYAATYVRDKKIGVLPFIFQIRDLKTHETLNGIEVGDIGPKFGYHSKDNGFMKLTNFRVPRSALLSKFFYIHGDKLISRGNPKIIYSAMMNVRILLIGYCSIYLGKALTICFRYGNLRKQFKNSKDEEVPIINYQLQKYRLIPILSRTFVMHGAFHQIQKIINKLNQGVKKGDFSLLQECHIILCGSKSFFTQWNMDDMITCMQCCGGHGYSEFSGIPHMINQLGANTILEGENAMLTLQIGKFLMKSMKKLVEGKLDEVDGHCDYLKKFELFDFNPTDEKSFFRDHKNLINLFQKCSLSQIKLMSQAMLKYTEKMEIIDAFMKKV